MKRRFQLLILMLLTAVLCLSAAIASNRLSGQNEKTVSGGEPQSSAQGSGLSLFVGTNGLWGARSATGRVMIEPTWYYLRVMSDTVLIARHNDGKSDSFGLILTTGEQIVPFLYTAFEPVTPEIWLAKLSEGGATRYHLYRADGTRWMDRTWDSCEPDGNTVTVTEGKNQYMLRLTEQGTERMLWHTENAVGLHSLTMDFDADALRKLPADDTLRSLGTAAADYLIYLFVTHEEPEASRMPIEGGAGLKNAYRYEQCRLRSASVRRITAVQSSDYPVYQVLMQVRYAENTGSGTEVVDTAMTLTVGRDLAGAYIYRKFSDARMDAKYGIG